MEPEPVNGTCKWNLNHLGRSIKFWEISIPALHQRESSFVCIFSDCIGAQCGKKRTEGKRYTQMSRYNTNIVSFCRSQQKHFVCTTLFKHAKSAEHCFIVMCLNDRLGNIAGIAHYFEAIRNKFYCRLHSGFAFDLTYLKRKEAEFFMYKKTGKLNNPFSTSRRYP